jgi:hypothetical protein
MIFSLYDMFYVCNRNWLSVWEKRGCCLGHDWVSTRVFVMANTACPSMSTHYASCQCFSRHSRIAKIPATFDMNCQHICSTD